MRNWITMASIVALAAGSANCNSHPGTNSSSNILPLANLTAPSALEARSGNGGGGSGKGGGNSSKENPNNGSSLTMEMVADANGDGASAYGDSIRFHAVTSETTQPQIMVTCSQNGALVYRYYTGYWTGWPYSPVVSLSSGAWTGGAASCNAELYYSIDGTRTYNLASLAFNVEG